MSSLRKYAGLPDLDAAPDIYETPELTDDGSTQLTSTTLRSESPNALDAEPSGDDSAGIDRHRINQDEARNHFLPADERRQLSSSRIAGKRKSHRSLERRRRLESDGIINGLGSPEDSEDESMERKLTRLRREILEVKDEAQRRKDESAATTKDAVSAEASEADRLAELLEAVEVETSTTKQSAVTRLERQLSTSLKPIDGAGQTRTKIESQPQGAALDQQPSKSRDRLTAVASLDARLKSLEDVLGLDAIRSEKQDDAASFKPILPTLNALDRQYHTLTTTSESSIDKMRDRVRKLVNETEILESRRTQAKRALESATGASSLRSKSTSVSESGKPYDLAEDVEQTAKINALYGTLSTIESMAPLLPWVLERLRSLRDLHANAAEASTGLAEVEKAQGQVNEELKSWQGALERVEKAMQQNRETLKENTEVVEGWVKDLEERMRSFA